MMKMNILPQISITPLTETLRNKQVDLETRPVTPITPIAAGTFLAFQSRLTAIVNLILCLQHAGDVQFHIVLFQMMMTTKMMKTMERVLRVMTEKWNQVVIAAMEQLQPDVVHRPILHERTFICIQQDEIPVLALILVCLIALTRFALHKVDITRPPYPQKMSPGGLG